MKNTAFTILDGAMGTMLRAEGLGPEERGEDWNLLRPEKVSAVQARYVAAGSDLLYANTFGASSLAPMLPGVSSEDLIAAGIACARKAAEGADHPVRVALDVSPLPKMTVPFGPLQEEETYEVFRRMAVAGEKAGADLVIFETFFDLNELCLAVRAAKENTKLPVWATMTYNGNGRTFLGITVHEMANALNDLGVDAMGFNCSLGPDDLIPMAEELLRRTDKPVIFKPNAGLPDPVTKEYHVTPEGFASAMAKAADMGIAILGGCCGTTPEYLAALAEMTASRQPGVRPEADLMGEPLPKRLPFGEEDDE